MSGAIYLDYAATSPLRPEVREAMQPFLRGAFGNPSSIHSYGREARTAIEAARRTLLRTLGAGRGRLIFTGSGSEADNLAVLGFARRRRDACIIRSSVEHKAVIESTDALAAAGYEIRVAPVDHSGVVDLEALEATLPEDGRPALVSVMWANNETGVIQPVDDVGRLCRRRGALFHCDAVQASGKIPLSLEDRSIDLLTVSAHKLGGPKGIGALLVPPDLELEPVIYGGGQEGGLRSGTENVAGIVGFAEAARLAEQERDREAKRLATLRDALAEGLTGASPGLVLNGGDAPERLPNVLNVSVPGVDIEGTLTSLDLEGICVSSGSACTTGTVEPSHVLRAMGAEGERARNTIRFSLGWGTEADHIERVIRTFPRVVERVREYSIERGGRVTNR